jgi:hypothetical protein
VVWKPYSTPEKVVIAGCATKRDNDKEVLLIWMAHDNMINARVQAQIQRINRVEAQNEEASRPAREGKAF